MSGRATGWVLRHGPRDRVMRAVLLTIADAANPDGEHAHPGMAAMIEGSLYARSTVLATIRRLVDDGWVVVEEKGGGRGNATVFCVLMGRENAPPETVHHSDGLEARNGPGNRRISDRKGSSEPRETVQEDEASPLSATVKHNGKSVAATPQPRASANRVVTEWWEATVPRPTAKFIGVVKIVEGKLQAGWSVEEVACALSEAPAPTDNAIEIALRRRHTARSQHPSVSGGQLDGINRYRADLGLEPLSVGSLP